MKGSGNMNMKLDLYRIHHDFMRYLWTENTHLKKSQP